MAVLAPGAHGAFLASLAALATCAALALWRVALVQSLLANADHRAADKGPPAAPLAASAFHDAALGLARVCHAAGSFEVALHGVAAVLKGEIGAREARVYRVVCVDAVQVELAELVAARPDFHGIGRCLRWHESPLARAVRMRRPVLAPPDAAVLPIPMAQGVAAVIELAGIELEIDPAALAGLLDRAASVLTDSAQASAAMADHPEPVEPPEPRLTPLANRHILLLEAGTQPSLSIAPTLLRLGARVLRATTAEAAHRVLAEPQLDLLVADFDAVAVESNNQRHDRWCVAGLPAGIPRVAVSKQARPEDEAGFLERGFDALLCMPCSESELLTMLTRHLRVPACHPAGDAASGAAPRVAPTLLDADALARLAELDPSGENQLLQRVLRAYQSSVARLMPQFKEARRRNDLAGMRHVVHTLKSSSASIGAIKFSQICAEIETMIRSERTETLDARVECLYAELEFVLQAVRLLLGGGP
jgi:HPt (histidine-containing phosphotransfer) domain-containing protein